MTVVSPGVDPAQGRSTGVDPARNRPEGRRTVDSGDPRLDPRWTRRATRSIPGRPGRRGSAAGRSPADRSDPGSAPRRCWINFGSSGIAPGRPRIVPGSTPSPPPFGRCRRRGPTPGSSTGRRVEQGALQDRQPVDPKIDRGSTPSDDRPTLHTLLRYPSHFRHLLHGWWEGGGRDTSRAPGGRPRGDPVDRRSSTGAERPARGRVGSTRSTGG